MPRPSRNLDRALLKAGRALVGETGCAGLTIRQVAEAAGVNIGMFHYHFRTREAFLRAVLQEAYDEMFERFKARASEGDGPTGRLRSALGLLGRFMRDNRKFLARVLADALCGNAVAIEFFRANAPRHLGVLRGLVEDAQASGTLRPMPPSQAIGFCAGAIGLPVIVGGAIVESGALPRNESRELADTLLTDAAIDARIDLALSALAAPPAVPARRARNERRGNAR